MDVTCFAVAVVISFLLKLLNKNAIQWETNAELQDYLINRVKK